MYSFSMGMQYVMGTVGEYWMKGCERGFVMIGEMSSVVYF